MTYNKDGTLDLRKLPRIIFKALGRQNAIGLATHSLFDGPNTTGVNEPTIEIDQNLKNRKRMEIILHESIHLACPAMTEDNVAKLARYLAMVLWHLNYRCEA